MDMQIRSLDPAMTESPIPACLARNLTAPPELRAMINLLREAPLKWFMQIPPLLNYLNRIDILQTTIANARLRAGFKLFQAPEPDLRTTPGPLAPNVLDLYNSRRQTITNSRDRKSTRLNSSHSSISYAVFCLKKKMKFRPSYFPYTDT